MDPLVDDTGQPYAYTGDDPVNGTDPSGLSWYDPSWAHKAASAVVNTLTDPNGWRAEASFWAGAGNEFITAGEFALFGYPGFSLPQIPNPYCENGGFYTGGEWFGAGETAIASIGAGLAGVGGAGAQAAASIDTPYGVATQAASTEAQALRTSVENGATVYRQGSFGVQQTAEGQFWAPENPLTTPGYASGYGTPASGAPDWIMGGQVDPGEPFVTRPAPGLGNNPGGGLEVVTNPGGVKNLWFYMP